MTTEKQDINYWLKFIDEYWLETLRMVHPGKDVNQAAKEAFIHLSADEQRLNAADGSDFKRLVNSWLSNKRFPNPKRETPGFRKLVNLDNL